MKNLNEEIQAAIEKSLPKQMGEALQKRFTELEKIEKKHIDLYDLYTNQSKEVTELHKKNVDLEKTLIMKNSLLLDIDKREKDVTEREINAKVIELQYKLEESDKRAVEMHGIVQTVFKSPVYRKSYSILGGSQFAGNDGNGYPQYNNVNDKTGTVTEEEVHDTKE